MLSYIREVMIHFNIFFRSKIPGADRRTPSDVCWLAAGLAMAPNIEILHIVLFCTQPAVRTMPLPYLRTDVPNHDTVVRSQGHSLDQGLL
jgi:hypothetical protein